MKAYGDVGKAHRILHSPRYALEQSVVSSLDRRLLNPARQNTRLLYVQQLCKVRVLCPDKPDDTVIMFAGTLQVLT
jgi:hypothetical protein